MMYEAPPYYFCTADWIIANRLLGSMDPQWESQAWYTGHYAPQGVRERLPTVDAVKAMPNEPRKLADASVIKGAVANAAGVKVRLRGPVLQERTADEGGRFEFTRLPAGTYSLDVDALGTVADGLTADGRNRMADGRNRISVRTIPGIELPPWIGLLRKNTSGPVAVGGMGSTIIVRVLRPLPVDVTLRLGDWHVTVRTGPKPPLGLNVCEFAPLRGGTYHVSAPDLGVETDVFVDGQGLADVELRPTRLAEVVKRRGRVRGRILGAAGRVLVLLGEGLRREIALPPDGSFDFGDLPAGAYRLELAGKGVIAQDLRTDGTTAVDVQPITVSTETWLAEVVSNNSGDHPTGARSSAILCEVEGKDQWEVALSAGDWRVAARTGQKGPFKCEFGALAGGWYNVAPADLGVSVNVFVDGVGAAHVRFRQGPAEAGPPGGTGPVPDTGPAPPDKTLPVYLLLGRPPTNRRLLKALVAYIQRFQPAWGFDLDEASHARRVFILGREVAVSAAQAQRLMDAGCQVHRLRGVGLVLAEILERRVSQGQPLDESA